MLFCQDVISVVGPTASGKTSLAIKLATQKLSEYPGGIKFISADSRQVYREFPILSGADIDEFQNLDPKISIHGIGMISIDDEWSLGNFLSFSQPLLEEAKNNQKLTIIVGGTMLYHQHLFNQNDQVGVPPNENIRAAADALTIPQLQAWLQQIVPAASTTLNTSDYHNPRRLVRHIEIALWQKTHPSISAVPANHDSNQLNISQSTTNHTYITPTYDKNALPGKITARVEERWQSGAIDEVEAVLNSHPHLTQDNEVATKALSKLPLGFVEIRDFLLGKKSPAQTLELWSLHEWQYARRQLKWNILTEAQTL